MLNRVHHVKHGVYGCAMALAMIRSACGCWPCSGSRLLPDYGRGQLGQRGRKPTNISHGERSCRGLVNWHLEIETFNQLRIVDSTMCHNASACYATFIADAFAASSLSGPSGPRCALKTHLG